MTDTRPLHNGADGAGHLTCPNCNNPRTAGQYLCPGCWFALPTRARASLSKRDRFALTRLQELLGQLREATPLNHIEVTP